MLSVLGHGAAVHPDDLATAWTMRPVVLVSTAVVMALYARGHRSGTDDTGRTAAAALAVVGLLVATVSPLDALGTTLASAHMVQHVVLVLVVAPLAAFSGCGAALARGSPRWVTRGIREVRRGVGLGAPRLAKLRSPTGVWLVYVATFWFWHAQAPYEAALHHDAIHVAEHVTMLAAAYALWRVLVGPRHLRVSRGVAIVAVFALAVQSVFLAALITFARTPWYPSYESTSELWGLDPLQDQQLAGVVMWVPAGLVHVGVGIALLVRWFAEVDDAPVSRSGSAR